MSNDSLPEPDVSMLLGKSLFLDLDGTLFELIDRPEDVVADPPTRALLEALAERLEGRLAIVSGRSLEQIDAMLGPVAQRLAVSGSHGSEHRWRGVTAHPIRPPALQNVAEHFRDFANGSDGVHVEEKSFGVALHYRQAPHVEPAARDLAAKLATTYALHLQDGKMMVELRLLGGDKGTAVRRLMDRPPMAGTLPVFIGDDLTDEPGFGAARALGGHAVLVGPHRATHANLGLPDPAAVRRWLAEFTR